MDFHVIDPTLGKPDLIQVDDPDALPPNDRSVAIVYSTPQGIVDVEERISQFSQGDLLERADASGAPPSSFTMVSIGPDRGLAVLGEDGNTVLWITDKGVLIQVFGPDASLDQLMTLAKIVNQATLADGI